MLGIGRRTGDHAARRHHRRRRRHLVGDDPPARGPPAGDDHPAVGDDPHAADRRRRRRPLSRRHPRGARGGRPGPRDRRPRGAALRDDAAAGGHDPGSRPAHRPGAAALAPALVALAVAGHRRRHGDRPQPRRLDDQRGRRQGRPHPPDGAVRADDLRRGRPDRPRRARRAAVRRGHHGRGPADTIHSDPRAAAEAVPPPGAPGTRRDGGGPQPAPPDRPRRRCRGCDAARGLVECRAGLQAVLLAHRGARGDLDRRRGRLGAAAPRLDQEPRRQPAPPDRHAGGDRGRRVRARSTGPRSSRERSRSSTRPSATCCATPTRAACR